MPEDAVETRLGRWRPKVLANMGARVLALASLALATLIVARTGGPSAVGVYALLRVLPGLVGVLVSCGLPGAVAYFLAGSTRDDPHLTWTIVWIAVLGGAVGTVLWVGASPFLRKEFFPNLSVELVAFAGLTVLSQLLVATSKSCSQGRDDLRGANIIFVLEELMFLPAYGIILVPGWRGYPAMIAALLLADIVTAAWALLRLGRRGFFKRAEGPSLALGRTVAGYGIRAQVGGVISLMNLRLDFLLLDVMTSPAVLGTYAIASKYAELLKIPPLAITYVLYPRFSKDGLKEASRRARGLIARATLLTLVIAVPLWLAAGFILPTVYGNLFQSSVLPARIILLGLATEGAAGVVTGFLYGIGRPGLNSLAMAVGLVVTVALDLLLIPHHGAVGAAVASAVAYATTTVALLVVFRSLRTRERRRAPAEPLLPAAALERTDG
jgi:O-antigen/teichoic acid export membrane protein